MAQLGGLGCVPLLALGVNAANDSSRAEEQRKRDEASARSAAERQQRDAEAQRRGTADALDPATAQAVAVVPPKKGFCPGARAEVVFEVTRKDGSKQTTWTDEREKAGHLGYADFSFSSPHGKFDKNGDLTVEADPLVTMDSGVTVKVALARRPEVAVEQSFPPRLAFSGAAQARRSRATTSERRMTSSARAAICST